MTFVTTFCRDESGTSAIEYGLIVAVVAVAAMGSIRGFGLNLSGLFLRVATTFANS